MLEHITDHVARGLALLPRQFRKDRIQALLATWLEEFQEAEDALWDLLDATLLTATGDRLDRYARLLGESRQGLTDSLLRKVLLARVAANRSRGRDRDVTAVLSRFDNDFTIEDVDPAGLIATLPDFQGEGVPARLGGLLRRTVAGGVGAQLITPSSAGALFRFAVGSEDVETSAAAGFGDAAQTTGGHLAGVYE